MLQLCRPLLQIQRTDDGQRQKIRLKSLRPIVCHRVILWRKEKQGNCGRACVDVGASGRLTQGGDEEMKGRWAWMKVRVAVLAGDKSIESIGVIEVGNLCAGLSLT